LWQEVVKSAALTAESRCNRVQKEAWRWERIWK
jgi:hypothetical protein